jgi:RNA polymerase sigma-70 factor (ECF subfamily)
MSALPGTAPMALDDLALARRCAARDAAAIRQVVTVNNQRLFRAAWTVLKDRGEAEEAVQAGYLKAFAHIGEFGGRSSLSTWLTRIVVNEALARLRSARRRNSQLAKRGIAVLDEYREALMRGSQPEAPDSEMARRQLRAMIERAVAALPDSFRAVFVLREVEGLSIEETAEVLDILPATVKTRLLRARRRLQDELAPDVRSALTGAFPFAGADCEAMTARILAQVTV